MTPTNTFTATGVVTVWFGNEESLTLANPAIEVGDQLVATRGETWSFPSDVSRSDVRDDAGFVGIAPIQIHEADVAWLAGPAYVDHYTTLIGSGLDDALEIGAWDSLPNGWLVRFGSAAQFYEAGAVVASAARQWCYDQLASGRSVKNAGIRAARGVDTGSPGVPRGDRRLADAVWYSMTGDFDLYARAVHLAAAALRRTDAEIKAEVDERVDFYRARAIDAHAQRNARQLDRARKALTRYGERHLRDQRTIEELEARLRALTERLNRAIVPANQNKTTFLVIDSAHEPSNMIGARTKNPPSFHGSSPSRHRKAVHLFVPKLKLGDLAAGNHEKLIIETYSRRDGSNW